MLNPDDRWIWDFWHVQDQDLHHLFYLQAPRSLGDPELRHRNATIGHATSTDLSTWTEHGTVLAPGDGSSIDATATWTGSVVRGDDGLWRMFYTGSHFLTADSLTNVETIGVATSPDLYTWTKDDTFALRADAAHYERLGDSSWPEECWRDPWVSRDDAGRWHMLITARAKTGVDSERGVVGHATSEDLQRWVVQPPLSDTESGFGHLEVLQRITIDGQPMVLFSAHAGVVTAARCDPDRATGVWIAPWGERITIDQARRIAGPDLYSGRVIDREGQLVLLGFRLDGTGNEFIGGIADPIDFTMLLQHSGVLASSVKSAD